MKVLSLKLKNEIFEDAEKLIKKIKTKRNTYINDALDFYNKINERKLKREALHRASKIVRLDSLEVLHEFEKLDDLQD